MVIKKLEERLLKEIILEFNQRQRLPISLNSVDLQPVSGGEYKGHVVCSEPRRTWKIPIEVRLMDKTVSWKVENFNWYNFKLE
jgi:hypothetical protein